LYTWYMMKDVFESLRNSLHEIILVCNFHIMTCIILSVL
jgi:hypothetical protein